MPGNRRLINAAGACACFGLLAYALYAQYRLGLQPCPLCIFQRITLLALGIFFLLAAVHHPRGRGAYAYALLVGLAALATVGVSARHWYVQSQPPGTIPACGAPLNTLLEMFPVTEVIKKVLHAGGECAEINWTFLGLTMPAWVLLWALLLGIVGVLANLQGHARRASAWH